ncbi:unnamed protein product [Acidithrix sp. C25]|nr:unnamed protein product [Acidithrix sp. C25]
MSSTKSSSPTLYRRSTTASIAARLSAMKRIFLPRAAKEAIRFGIVFDFPVLGGPSMT